MLGHVHRTFTIALVGCAMMVVGCGGTAEHVVRQQPVQKEDPDQKKPKVERRPLAYYEATLRPTDFDKEIEEVQRVHVVERERAQLVIPRDSMALSEETILGFRIQILSTASVDEAERKRSEVQDLFLTDSVYVVYDPPVYKVRVGDFPTRVEANGRLADVQERGYQDAWVVPDKVVRRKWVAVGRKDTDGDER